jgi:HD-GYP domain-containing protein (c-di-GMP phosphodiesterase class II)
MPGSSSPLATPEKTDSSAAPAGGMNAARPSAARSGYLPLPLDRVLIEALAAIPVYLHTGAGSAVKTAERFTLYSGEMARFTESHRVRLQNVGVKFIYIPMSCQGKFQTQVEENLVKVAADPNVALSAKSALVYETSLELINEVLTEQGVAKNLPRLEKVARSISTLVMQNGQAFSHLFATAQHDFYTATHMVNVGTWMTSLACAMGIEDETLLNAACTAGMVHDVGKMFVPENVLNKPGTLSDVDWNSLRSHPQRGFEHLKSQGVADEIVLRVCLEHHERMDGTGYPNRIAGNDMHIMSKICAVVDSFDAMTACRPFKNKVKTIAEAVQILQKETPDKYDAAIVNAWVGLLTKASHEGLISEPVTIDANRMGRRKHTRYPINCPVKACVLHATPNGYEEGQCLPATAFNISEGGLGILCKTAMPVSSYVRAYLNGTGTLENKVLEGRIVRCRICPNAMHEVGIQLCQPGVEEKAAAAVAQPIGGS